VALGRHFEFVGTNQEHGDERCEVAGTTVVNDEVLTYTDSSFFQHALVDTASHHDRGSVIITCLEQHFVNVPVYHIYL